MSEELMMVGRLTEVQEEEFRELQRLEEGG
jgi:hypothetical protein